jgi:hypothetical protein
VTTVRVEEARHVKLTPLGPNHEDLLLYLNNSRGNLPLVSPGENGFVQYPTHLFWDHGFSFLHWAWELGMRYKY